MKNFEPHMSFNAVPVNTDKETENKFLVFEPVKMLLKDISTSVSSSAEVHNDQCHIFLDDESYAEYISLRVNKFHFIKYP